MHGTWRSELEEFQSVDEGQMAQRQPGVTLVSFICYGGTKLYLTNASKYILESSRNLTNLLTEIDSTLLAVYILSALIIASVGLVWSGWLPDSCVHNPRIPLIQTHLPSFNTTSKAQRPISLWPCPFEKFSSLFPANPPPSRHGYSLRPTWLRKSTPPITSPSTSIPSVSMRYSTTDIKSPPK